MILPVGLTLVAFVNAFVIMKFVLVVILYVIYGSSINSSLIINH